MKTLSKLLSVAVIASSCLMAGGPFTSEPVPDVEPVEPAVAEIPQVNDEVKPESNIQPYIGGALGSSSATVNSSAEVCGGCQYDKITQTTSQSDDTIINWGGSDSSTTGTILAGAEITDNIAVEARITKAVSDYEIEDHQPISYTNMAIYLKPQYKFDDFTIYALLGYGVSSIDFMDQNTKSSGFQYGAGGSYDISDQLSVFADYTTLMGSSEKISDATTLSSLDSVNAGIIFKP